jgi:hypothetical protein
MSPLDATRIEKLERDLRDARSLYDEVDVVPDAWQRNQEMVAAAALGGRRRTLVAVAAGVAVLLVVMTGWLGLGGRDEAADAPGSGGSGGADSFSAELADPVQVAEVDTPSGSLVLEVGVDASAGRRDEPFLCYRLARVGSTRLPGFGAGGCTSKVDEAERTAVTVDHLTGGADGRWATLAGSVDVQAAAVTMWQADGTSSDLDLVAVPGTDLRAFGFVGNGSVPTRPVRLVAWADSRKQRVLESVDVVERFDRTWLPGEEPACGSVQRVPAATFAGGTTVQASFTAAEITYEGAGGGTRTVCRSMEDTLVAVVRTGDELVVVAAPEVADFRLVGAGRFGGPAEWQPVGRTVWRATVRQVQNVGADDELEFLDESGGVLRTLPMTWIL